MEDLAPDIADVKSVTFFAARRTVNFWNRSCANAGSRSTCP